jgi:XapX domain-containing protein
MKPYLVSLLLGLLVGVIYALFKVRSPAPPVIALVGLLGILIGEQLVPIAQRLLSPQPISVSEIRAECIAHVFGELPQRTPDQTKAPTASRKEQS